MFSEFRQVAKAVAKEKGLTYSDLSRLANVEESTIKSFMCGASDSRRIAEKIADCLGFALVYCNGVYSIDHIGENVNS